LCLVRALDILKRERGLLPRVSWAGQRWRSGDNGDYLTEVESEIARCGLTSQWDWLDQRKDIAALLGGHDALVHPSYGEGLPNVVCEAMACGRPVILSDTLDHPRLVTNGVNGFLFDWHDPADLARKIDTFSGLPWGERRAMGNRGRDFAEKNLSLDRYVDEFERLLSGLVR
jgi:glycosyltransferase involved in cell wall biosynthesis